MNKNRMTGYCMLHKMIELDSTEKPQRCPECDKTLFAITEWIPCPWPDCTGSIPDWRDWCGFCERPFVDGWNAEDYALAAQPTSTPPEDTV